MYTTRSKIGMCCQTCRPQKPSRVPYMPNNVFGLSVVKKIATSLSDTTTSTTTETVVETKTTPETRHWPLMITEAYTDLYTTEESVTTMSSPTPSISESPNATSNTPGNHGHKNTSHSGSEINPTTPDVFSSTTGSTVDLISGTSQHPMVNSSATEPHPTISRASPSLAQGGSTHTAESLQQGESSTGYHVTANRSSHWQTEMLPVLLKYLGGYGLENSTVGNGVLATIVTENVTGTLDFLVQESQTKANNSENHAGTVSHGAPQTYPSTNVALHFSVNHKSPPADPLNVSVDPYRVNSLSPNQDLNMIHRGSVLSSLTPTGEDSRADAVKLNVVSSVKDQAVHSGGTALANTSTAVNDANTVVLKGPPENLAFDRTPGRASQAESNYISQPPSGKDPQNSITSLWLLATTPEPYPDAGHKTPNMIDASKPQPSSDASFHLSQEKTLADESLVTSISNKEGALYSKDISNSRPSVSIDNIGIGSSVNAPKSKILRDNSMSSMQNENTPEKVTVLESRVFPASATGGEYTSSALNSDPGPQYNSNPRLLNSPILNSQNLNYRSRWWEDVLPHWQTGDGHRGPNANRPTSSGQASESISDTYVPRGHKVEIISYQPQFQKFLEELSSLDGTSADPGQPLTTPGPERPRVIPNCRFQCVFFRELVNPQDDTSGQLISLLTNGQPTLAVGLTQTVPSSSRLDTFFNAGFLASLQRPKARK